MKKQTFIFIIGLILIGAVGALESAKEEHCFRPAFQKKLKRVKPVGLHSFRSLGLKQTRISQKHKKKEVFIDWRKLYWGKLSDLIYGAEEPNADGINETTVRGKQDTLSNDTEDSQAFAKELRHELKSFAKQYGLKIVWRKKPLGLMDGTAAFLEYWDKGLSHKKQGRVISFDELCALGVRDTSVKGTSAGDTGVKDTSAIGTKSKGASAQNPSFTNMLFADFSCGYVACEPIPFENVLLKKGA